MSRTTLRAICEIISRLTTAWLPYLLNSGACPRPSPAMTILLVVQRVSQPSRVFTRLSSAIPSLTSFSMKASRIASEIGAVVRPPVALPARVVARAPAGSGLVGLGLLLLLEDREEEERLRGAGAADRG